jgi:peptidyl-prolyl cis-trans isomerase B (cyclophilin B)
MVSCGGGEGEKVDPYEKKTAFTIEMENGDVITGELYPDLAPETVANFEGLAKDGFYNGTIFHRVIPGFMVQGGDPEGTGMGGSGKTIKGEFSSNGFENPLKHTRGVLSMARANDKDSGSSQFFIMVAEATNLDGNYAAFGKVISGMEHVDKIVNQERNANDKPLKDQAIKTITIGQAAS